MIRKVGVLVFMALAMASCGGGVPGAGGPSTTVQASASPLVPSVKGYELYSWRTGDEWQFSLMTGTNRAKTDAEVKLVEASDVADGVVRVSAIGVNEITETLRRLPTGEEIVWGGGPAWADGGFALPPEDVVRAIERVCQESGLTLSVDS